MKHKVKSHLIGSSTTAYIVIPLKLFSHMKQKLQLAALQEMSRL
jgi:hypothetical protein